MIKTMALSIENAQSWCNHREYNSVCTSFEDQANLKKKMGDPNVIEAIHTWMKSCDDYHKKKREYDVNKTSEGWDLYRKSEWYKLVLQGKIFLLIEGKTPEHFIDNYDEWLIKTKKKMPKELPDDVLSIIKEYSKPMFIWYKEYNEAVRMFPFELCIHNFVKLKEKLGDPTIREQLKICVYAQKDYIKKEKYLHGKLGSSIAGWTASVCVENLVSLLNPMKYDKRDSDEHEWDDIDEHWMDESYHSWM